MPKLVLNTAPAHRAPKFEGWQNAGCLSDAGRNEIAFLYRDGGRERWRGVIPGGEFEEADSGERASRGSVIEWAGEEYERQMTANSDDPRLRRFVEVDTANGIFADELLAVLLEALDAGHSLSVELRNEGEPPSFFELSPRYVLGELSGSGVKRLGGRRYLMEDVDYAQDLVSRHSRALALGAVRHLPQEREQAIEHRIVASATQLPNASTYR